MTRSVVLDVDPGCDDAVALALALASDAIEVVGVTTVAGNATLANTTANARAVLDLFGRTDVPVVPGCDRPLVESLVTAEDVHGRGGLPGGLPDPETEPAEGHASTFLLEQSRAVADLTLLAVGPLTNVAVATAIDPAFPDRLADLRVMGGALDVEGNASPVAEFNFFADPAAAARVVRDAGPRIVPLDVTEQATLAPETIESLLDRGDLARTVAGWLAYDTPTHLDRDGVGRSLPLHDPLVLLDLLAEVLEFERTALEVGHGSGHSRGELRYADDRDPENRRAAVALDIDVEAFRSAMADLLDRLS